MVTRLSNALVVETVMVRPTWSTFDDAIQGLVDRLVTAGRLPRSLAMPAVESIRMREAMTSTAMVDIGISIPHARLEGITGIVAAMAVAPSAVYHVADGLPISIVTLVLSSPQLTGEHLTFLSALSMFLQSTTVRDQLRQAGAAEDAVQLVRRNEGVRR